MSEPNPAPLTIALLSRAAEEPNDRGRLANLLRSAAEHFEEMRVARYAAEASVKELEAAAIETAIDDPYGRIKELEAVLERIRRMGSPEQGYSSSTLAQIAADALERHESKGDS